MNVPDNGHQEAKEDSYLKDSKEGAIAIQVPGDEKYHNKLKDFEKGDNQVSSICQFQRNSPEAKIILRESISKRIALGANLQNRVVPYRRPSGFKFVWLCRIRLLINVLTVRQFK